MVEAWVGDGGTRGVSRPGRPGVRGPRMMTAIARLMSALVLVAGTVAAVSMASSAPAVAAQQQSWASVSVGDDHSCGVSADGEAYCWGLDNGGQLGNGELSGDQVLPSLVDTPDGVSWASVSAGAWHSCGVSTDGEAYCWGLDSGGQLGNGELSGDQVSPSLVDTPDGVSWASVSAGTPHSCALTTDGEAYCWGFDSGGQLGNGELSGEQVSPSLVDTPDGVSWASVSAGDAHSCAVTTDGEAYCWGLDLNGQVGDGDPNEDQVSPSLVDTPDEMTWAVVAAGGLHSCGVSSDGMAYCWGENNYGQLGDGAVGVDQTAPSPVDQPAGVDRWAAVTAGYYYSCGSSVDGTAFCWGLDANGSLGNGTEAGSSASPSPVDSPDGVTWKSISADSGTCGVTAEQDAFCWGSDRHGRLGNGPALSGDQESPTLVGRSAQSIEFGPIGDVTYDVQPFEVEASASSGLAVSLTADGECSIDGSTVSVTGVGECTVTASQEGDNHWLPAEPVSRTFVIAKADQVITFEPLPDVTYGDAPFEVEVSASSGLAASLTAAGMCSIDESTVSVTGAGECTVTASQPGDADWNAADPVAQTFTIEGAPADVVVTGWEHVYDGQAHGVELTTDPEGLEVEVTYDGAVEEPVDAGSYEVVVTVTDPDYDVEPVTGTLMIAKADQAVTLDAPASVVFGDGPFDVEASASSGLSVEVTAAGECGIEELTVTPAGAGECVLSADQPGDGNWNAAPTVTHTVVVDPAPTTIVVGPSAEPHVVGDPVRFTATVTGPDDTGVPTGSVVFTVDDADEPVADVILDEDGVAAWSTSGLPVGEHAVTAEYVGTGDHAGSASEAVTVETVTAELSLTGLPDEMTVGDDVTVELTGFMPGEGVELVFHSDPVTVATVTADQVGAGAATFTIPDVVAGEHRLIATGADSGLTVEAATTVAAQPTPTPTPTPTPPEPELPDTGAGLAGSAGLIGALLMAAGLAMYLRRPGRVPGR